MQRRAGLVEGWGRRELTPVPPYPARVVPTQQKREPYLGSMTGAPPFPLGFCTGSWTVTWHMRKQDSRWCPVYQACGCRIQTHLPVRWVLCRVSHVCMHHRVLEARRKQFFSAAPSPLPLQTAHIKGQEPRAMLIVRCQEMFAMTLSLKWLLQTWVSEKKKKKSFTQPLGAQSNADPPRRNDGSFNELLLKW